MGLGAIPGDHPLNLGMLGMHGTEYANFAITECDLLFAIGVRFDDRVTGRTETFASNAKIVHIDVDPAEIGKNKRVDVPIVGDVKAVLSDMLVCMKKKSVQHDTWIQKIRHWKEHHPLKCPDDGSPPAVHYPADERPSKETPSSSRKSGRTRCGLPSTSASNTPVPGSQAAGSGRWAMACRQRWEPISRGRIFRSSMLPATGVSR
jgi:hypothetical protein